MDWMHLCAKLGEVSDGALHVVVSKHGIYGIGSAEHIRGRIDGTVGGILIDMDIMA